MHNIIINGFADSYFFLPYYYIAFYLLVSTTKAHSQTIKMYTCSKYVHYPLYRIYVILLITTLYFIKIILDSY